MVGGWVLTDWPATGWQVRSVAQDLRVAVFHTMPDLAPELDAQVARLWASTQKRLGNTLFNGQVFSADEITPHLVRGHWTEYRRVVAQMEQPDLFGVLGLRPTALAGTLLCADGVVFGRRPVDALYQPGLWQLPPAGSIDPRVLREDGTVDLLDQLFTELDEELGLERSTISASRLLCLVEHAGSHVLDLGVRLDTELTQADIRAAHAAGGNSEYPELLVVPQRQLAAMVSSMQGSLTPQALAFLAYANLDASLDA